MSQLYTASRLRVLRSCLYKHWLRYTVGLATAETAQMRFGTLLHKALEAYFLAWKAGLDRIAAASVILSEVKDVVEQAKLQALVAGYDAKWGGCNWEILGVEVTFEYELDGYHVGGKIDALIRDLDTGKVWVLEHKTTTADTSPGSPYWEKLALDTQVSVYIDAAMTLGYEVAGCIYDVLSRPDHDLKLATPMESRRYTAGKGCAKCGGSAGGKKGIVQGRGYYEVVFASVVKQNPCEGCKATGWKLDDAGKPQAPRLHANQRDTNETIEEFVDRLADVIAERNDEFYQREGIMRLDDQIEALREDLIATIRTAEVLAASRLMPKNTDACAAYGQMCSYFAICSGRASIDDFPRTAIHAELAA